jgi:hypothetical protein
MTDVSLAIAVSRGPADLNAPLVTVECLVGLTGIEVRRPHDRVRAALQNSNIDFPPGKHTDGSGSERPFHAQQMEAVRLRSED